MDTQIYHVEIVVFDKNGNFKVAIESAVVSNFDPNSQEMLEQFYLKDEQLRISDFMFSIISIDPTLDENERVAIMKLVKNSRS